jgi:hypothetical protein
MGQKLVGEQSIPAGTGEGSIAQTGEEVVSQVHGSLFEQNRRGNVYMGVTAVTGVAPGTAIGTTAAFALYNPLNSGVRLAVLRASMSYLSGTLGIGFVNWIYHTAAVQAGAAITGTAISVVQGNGGGGAGKGKPLTTATVVAGVLARPFGNLPPMLATSVLTPWRLDDNVDGALIVPPGAGVSLQATAAAGTTPLVIFGCTWEEVPVV